MRRWGFPVAPAVIGLILGPLAEAQFRRALAISQGDPGVFFTQPISAGLLALTAPDIAASLDGAARAAAPGPQALRSERPVGRAGPDPSAASRNR